MKIEDVRCEVYLREEPQEFAWGKGTIGYPRAPEKMPVTVLRIVTDDGVEGVNLGNREIAEPVLDAIRSVIIDRDPLDREWIWQTFWNVHPLGRFTGSYGRITLGALSAVDIALWDLAGKVTGLSIYKLMGAYRDKIKIYASSYHLPTIQAYVDEALSCKQQGITAYKIHPYWRIGKEDVKACRAVREAVGDDMDLMLDPAGAYSREEALGVGKELEKLNFHWFEEPIRDSDIEGLVMLREKLNVPICATESLPNSMFSVPEYLLRGAVDMIRCDSVIGGGITPLKKIADMCNAFGMRCEIHHSRWSAADTANLHVECAIKNCMFHEVMWPEPWDYGLKEYPVLDNEGYLHVPQKPGLGIEIDWEVLGKPVASY